VPPDERVVKEPELAPLIGPAHTYGSVTDKVSVDRAERQAAEGLAGGFGVAFLLVMILFYAIAWVLIKGVGIWGIKIPVGWGFAIVNFVWWIGIGHAGTLISAFCYWCISSGARRSTASPRR